jgi:hypothetical protein
VISWGWGEEKKKKKGPRNSTVVTGKTENSEIWRVNARDTKPQRIRQRQKGVQERKLN